MLGLHVLDEWTGSEIRAGRERKEGAGGQDVEVTAHWTARESYKTHLF